MANSLTLTACRNPCLLHQAAASRYQKACFGCC